MVLRGGMSGQRFVYDSERQRHERFIGRAELIARLDRLLVDPAPIAGSWSPAAREWARARSCPPGY